MTQRKVFLLINDSIRQNAINYITGIVGDGKTEIEIRPRKEPRKLSQNAALWGVAYPPIMESVGLHGEKDREELHEFYCGEFFGWVEYEIMGMKKWRPVRTTTKDERGQRDLVSKSVMYQLYTFVQHQAAENGIYVPDPDPVYGYKQADYA